MPANSMLAKGPFPPALPRSPPSTTWRLVIAASANVYASIIPSCISPLGLQEKDSWEKGRGPGCVWVHHFFDYNPMSFPRQSNPLGHQPASGSGSDSYCIDVDRHLHYNSCLQAAAIDAGVHETLLSSCCSCHALLTLAPPRLGMPAASRSFTSPQGTSLRGEQQANGTRSKMSGAGEHVNHECWDWICCAATRGTRTDRPHRIVAMPCLSG